jgi:ferritin-like metal-binding protein YciE
MKTKITSLNDALAFLLQGLYFTETKLRDAFPICCSDIASERLKREVERYVNIADSKLLKLERVFNYLMKEPVTRTNEVVNSLINETNSMLAAAASGNLRDILSIGCIQNINAYKISSYRSAYMIAVELEMDVATDLLQQILEWEIETSETLSLLSTADVNKSQRTF